MPRIERLYAWVAQDDGPDDEGVAAHSIPGGIMMPLVGADRARIDSLRPQAERVARWWGKPVTLVEFSVRRDLERIDP